MRESVGIFMHADILAHKENWFFLNDRILLENDEKEKKLDIFEENFLHDKVKYIKAYVHIYVM